ncbi:MAG: c-type cytochrome [Zoogloeaceae bacterium]|jgi:cytochrome c5|nr:c-type cytochrome [Zoogloeaceae bacterium]
MFSVFSGEASMSNQNDASKSVLYASIVFAVLVILAVLVALFRSYTAAAVADDPSAEERIRPVGVFIKSDVKAPEAVIPAASVEETADTAVLPKDPASIYASACHICHDTGVAGAPKKGDKAAWAPRIAAGMDALYQSALNGKNAMPPRGNTPSGVSNDELKATVDYLVELSS